MPFTIAAIAANQNDIKSWLCLEIVDRVIKLFA
jgi:hypothetical protein